MRPTLADSLDVVIPALPAALVPPEAIPLLRQWTKQLPAVAYAGFETPLSAASRVDFQQCILADRSELRETQAHLAKHLYARGTGQYRAWQRVQDLFSVWSAPSSLLYDTVEDVWLEFDAAPEHTALPPPSVFFGIRRDVSNPRDRLAIAHAALDLLLDAPTLQTVGSNLERCFLGGGTASVSHVGVMLARKADALRINVRGLSHDALTAYLTDVEWPGDRVAARDLMKPLATLVDHVTVCLDVGPVVHPPIGFECGFKAQPPAEPRWTTFVDYLVEQGLCLPAKREALLAWPLTVLPTTGGIRWPAHLLHASLLAPANRFSVLDRQLSHVKMTLRPQGTVDAKAYFGFRHLWIAPEPSASIDARRATRAREAKTPLAASLQSAVAFILRARDDNGWWRDFPGSAGGSDAWTTAFAAAALVCLDDREAKAAAHRAWSLIARRGGPFDGWAYNNNLPVDADATIWALRLADAVDLSDSSRARHASAFLSSLQLPDGGFSSYLPDALAAPMVFLGREFDGARDGWCRIAHGCITAAAAGLGNERALEFLRRTQETDGSWQGYWWAGKDYATSLAAEALSRAARPSDRPLIEAAVRWGISQFRQNGAVRSPDHRVDSAFATASTALLLTLAADRRAVREPLELALSWLAGTQRPDGSWTPSAWMRVPAPDVVDPDVQTAGTTHALYLDEGGIFTTARVISALNAAHARL